MRLRAIGMAGVILCLTTASAQAQRELQVYASVVDQTGAAVQTLEPGDIRLTEDDVDLEVTKIEPVDWAVKVQVLLDNGFGLGESNIGILRESVGGLLKALPDGTEVTLVTTAPQPRFLVRATTDRMELLKGLDNLVPDRGVGRFVDALHEATERMERDKSDHITVIIMVATTAGELRFRDRDVTRITERLQDHPSIVHVVLFSRGEGGSPGVNQTQIGLAVTKMTRGRYENINTPNVLSTLLPELGAQVAAGIGHQSRQYRVTAKRASGASDDLGRISAGARNGLSVVGLSFDGRIQ